MTVGVVMLVHKSLDRAAQVARHWAVHGCPVVIHVDRWVDRQEHEKFTSVLSDLPNVDFARRHHCEWGTWSIVRATQTAAQMMLDRYPEVRHVYLASGSCLPLRPIAELVDYLAARPQTDFIESATTEDIAWAKGGLDAERFTLRFTFSWKRHRALFDGYVRLQRWLRFKRKLPARLVPHLGSQWWCLTRRTVSAILGDSDRAKFDAFFKRVWIPDESYFQSLARLHSRNIESRSLTLSKFDYRGIPHIFYDDHQQLLRRSDCFVARKIWPRAGQLYQAFLCDAPDGKNTAEPNPSKIDRVFSNATERRTRGRAGLYMQSRYPVDGWENGVTSAPYSIFQGYTELFEDFAPWLEKVTSVEAHEHLFALDRVEFAGGESIYRGGLCDSATTRDNNPRDFLSNLIWNSKDKHQCFQFGPDDAQDLKWFMAKDPNASISVITGAWVVPLFHSNLDFSQIRTEAARLQKIESAHMAVLRSPFSKARVRIMTMAEFVESPMEPLQMILDQISPRKQNTLSEVPKMVDLTGFGEFLQNLKNRGMHPHLMGDFPTGEFISQAGVETQKPYLVQK